MRRFCTWGIVLNLRPLGVKLRPGRSAVSKGARFWHFSEEKAKSEEKTKFLEVSKTILLGMNGR
jgi:hypothetical protein